VRPALLDEIAHFFDVYKDLDRPGAVTIEGWHGRAYADEVIAEGRAAFAAGAG
jgi:inorganic pyrophosphatase